MTATASVVRLEDVDRTQIALVGGKAAHLGELSKVEGISVPSGFCVTAEVFRRVMAENMPSIGELLDRMSQMTPDDHVAIRTVSQEVRRIVETSGIPDDVSTEITEEVSRLGEHGAYAVRSSATAEDSPTASFAGQHDTYLNMVGSAAVLRSVSRCWSSLFTERAVTYRLRSGSEHEAVGMAVVVQRMVSPQVSGVLFTADPVTSNRTVASVEAVFGLGEALVSGRSTPDVYKVRDGVIVATDIATKHVAVEAAPAGGTMELAVESERQEKRALTDGQILRLVELGRRIEAHFDQPQDIEWCLVDDQVRIVQSRPITTLFPIPDNDEDGNHVYISVGHQQMMTDPMKPLGISVWQMTTPASMRVAGGRLFVDVTKILSSQSGRANLLEMAGRSDPLIRDALETVIARDGFITTSLDDGPTTAGGTPAIETDPSIVAELIERSEASITTLRRDIMAKSGTELFDFIQEDIGELRRILFEPRSHQAIMAGMEATWWLNDQLEAWLGERNAADALAQSVPHNVTSEMGLALLDVADVIRRHPEVVAFLGRVEHDDFLDELTDIPGGSEARDAISGYLERYGMRCVGEIDITRPRWSERPSTLLPVILGHVENFEPGTARQRFDRGLQQASAKERDLIERLRAMPDGDQKAEETKRMIDRVRTFIGYREYPKFGMVSRYAIYKQALLQEADGLVRDGVLDDRDDIYYLSFQELRDVVERRQVDDELVRRRKAEFRSYRALTPPRVLTSEGEGLTGEYRRDDLPEGALAGLAVSAGTVEGRARVVLDVANAALEPDDILVTAYTDPSWSPLFVTIKGLVTEVGGLMTHGAVIAREYGLPAVVGVEHATSIIRDGSRIRVHGTGGYVEILSTP